MYQIEKERGEGGREKREEREDREERERAHVCVVCMYVSKLYRTHNGLVSKDYESNYYHDIPQGNLLSSDIIWSTFI